MSETIETPLPPALRNHWWWRPGWTTGRHYYACHLTLDDQSQLRNLVSRYQRTLENHPGLDLIPTQWLHMTMQGIGFTDEISATELHCLDDALARELARIDPPTVSFRYLTVHPEAIYLKAHPADALYALRTRMYRAVVSVLRANSSVEDMPSPSQFIPRVSIAYVNADGETQPIADQPGAAIVTRPCQRPVLANGADVSAIGHARQCRHGRQRGSQ